MCPFVIVQVAKCALHEANIRPEDEHIRLYVDVLVDFLLDLVVVRLDVRLGLDDAGRGDRAGLAPGWPPLRRHRQEKISRGG